MLDTPLYKSYKRCQLLFLEYSKSYYLGAMLFDFNTFKHISAFYGLVRVADNIVDGEYSIEEKRNRLTEFTDSFFELYENDLYNCDWDKYHPIMMAVFDTISNVKIPINVFKRFFHSMTMDLETFEYSTFTDLENYMDGSAVIVGEVMLYIMANDCKFYDEKFHILHPYARDLGIAFQLTNFIRDIKEDLEMDPSRVYIPNNILKIYDIDLHKYNKYGIIDNKFRVFMKAQIELNREIYINAQYGINKLEPTHMIAINASKILYSSILDYIEKDDYRVFESKKIKVSFRDKLKLMYDSIPLVYLLKMMLNYVVYSYFMFVYFVF